MTKPRRRAAALYLRISKDAEGRGLGVERQRKECLALAEREDLDVIEVLTDNDISGYSRKKRPGFDRLNELMAGRAIDVVVTWAPDRLTRHPMELEDLIVNLEAARVEVLTTVAGTVDLSTAGGRLIARQLGGIARYESELKSERLRSKMDQLAESGNAPGGPAPYGYRREDKTYVVDMTEAAALLWMAQQLRDGKSLLGIAKMANELEVPTRGGGGWHHSAIRAVLMNPAIAGHRVHRRSAEQRNNGEYFGDGNWTPIMSADDFEALRATIKDPRRKRRRPSSRYPLTGLLVNEAGTRLIGRVDDNGVRVRRTYVRPVGAPGPHITIDADGIEQFVWAAVEVLWSETAPVEVERSQSSDEVAVLEAELDELLELRAAGEITIKEWIAQKNGVDKRLASARESLVVVLDMLDVASDHDWADLIGNERYGELRRLADIVLKSVVVRGAGGRGRWATIEERVTPIPR